MIWIIVICIWGKGYCQEDYLQSFQYKIEENSQNGAVDYSFTIEQEQIECLNTQRINLLFLYA